jgi:hypothetical protein
VTVVRVYPVLYVEKLDEGRSGEFLLLITLTLYYLKTARSCACYGSSLGVEFFFTFTYIVKILDVMWVGIQEVRWEGGGCKLAGGYTFF